MRRVLLLGLVALAALVGGDARGGTPSRLRVGLVLEQTGPYDPFGGIAVVGLRRAARDFGVYARALTPAAHEPSFLPNFAYFARRGYDLVIGVGFFQRDAVAAAALRYPRTRFVILDSDWRVLPHRPANVLGTVYRTEQPAFLAGYLAALMEERRPGPDVVGSVAGYRLPTVEPFVAGFRVGARRADPAIVTLNTYTNDFVHPAKCRSAALRQIARGAGVVFQVAGECGLGALQAAKEQGVWGIGVDSDQSSLGPHILTSVVKRLDVAAYQSVEALVHGRLETGRNVVHTLRDGGVALGRISPRVPLAVVAKVERLRRQVITGRAGAIPVS